MQRIAARPQLLAVLSAMQLLLLVCARTARSEDVATDAKATPDGRTIYQESCASCHGDALEGGKSFAPPLNGRGFIDKWSVQKPSALERFISQTMPPSAPGRLSPSAYKEVTQYIWSYNNSRSSASGAAADSEPGDERDNDLRIQDATINYDAAYREEITRRKALLSKMRPVDDNTLRQPQPEDWLQYRRTDDAHGFSPLTQINSGNVGWLTLAWSKALPVSTNGIAPLVRDGIMFIDSAGTVQALDVSTGTTLWAFSRQADARGAVTQPRGLALFEYRLIVPTVDNHVLALNARTGTLLWDHKLDHTKGLYLSAAPIVVKGVVIQGISGCWMMIEPRGCRVVGLDSETGSELWSFDTVPAAGPAGNTWNGADAEHRFGASVWVAGSYSPTTNLVYFGTGQTYKISTLLPKGNSPGQSNSALYTDTTLALEPQSGKLAWYYQHMARDVWDLDWAFERMLLKLNVKGAAHEVVETMGKIGVADVLDAKTGAYLFSYDVGMQNVITAIDPRTGRKSVNPAVEPVLGSPVRVCPFAVGVRNWPAGSYDESRGTLFMSLMHSCMNLTWKPDEKEPGNMDIQWSSQPTPDKDGKLAEIQAIDIGNRRELWSTSFRAPQISSMLATAGGIVFSGGRDRVFRALDSDSGRNLWSAVVDNVPSSSPIAFAFNGTEYVSIVTGGGTANDLARANLTPEIDATAPGTTLWVFKLKTH